MSARDLSGRPRRRPGVELRTAGETAILRRPGETDVRLNDTALALWELCDGTTEVEEMVRAVDAFFDVDIDVIRRDVAAALADLSEIGVLDWERAQ